MSKEFFLAVFISIYLPFPIRGQDNAFLQNLMNEGRIIKGIQSWNVEHGRAPILCVYSSRKSDSTGEASVITFYREDIGGYTEIYHHPVTGSVVGFYQTRAYEGKLIVIWLPGNSYIITVFSYYDGNVHLSLEDASQMMPEIYFMANPDSEYEIALTQKDWIYDKNAKESILMPVRTTIYKWESNHYDTLNVPWIERFSTKMK